MSSVVAFHVRTLVSQEKEPELPESAAECGNTWQGLLAKYNPSTSSWKTPQCSLFEDLEQSLETFPRWGSMRNGELYQRQPWEPPISETVFGFSVPTPVSSDGTSGSVIGKNDTFYTTSTGMPRKVNQKGTDGSVGLGRLVQMWPTPRSCSAMAATITPESAWNEKRKSNLETIVGQRFWPTPTAHMAKETNAPSEALRNEPSMASRVGGQLNPDWVEWLMNWPIKWSNLNEFNKQEFQRWQKASAKAIQDIGQMRTMWWDSDPAQTPLGQQPFEQSTEQHCDSLPEMPRVTSCERKMERSQQGSNLSLLREDVYIQEVERKNLQSGMREQTGLDKTEIIPRVSQSIVARVDRLKAIGNGQVPLCAATAWRILTEPDNDDK